MLTVTIHPTGMIAQSMGIYGNESITEEDEFLTKENKDINLWDDAW